MSVDDHGQYNESIRNSVAAICRVFPSSYWRDLDKDCKYPTDFVNEMAKDGFLSCLIPEQWGGSGMGVKEACIILEEICYSGGNAAACHAQMYIMACILKHGNDAQKARWLPEIASGKTRLQSFAVTEPDTGSDTTQLTTRAVRCGNHYAITGKKVWISRIEHSDLMLLLARTSERDPLQNKTWGLSTILVDLNESIGQGLEVQPIDSMINNHACELYFDELKVPVQNLLGEEGNGFRIILDSMNAERILIAAECIGDARFFLERATKYAQSREVFGRPIGSNQGIQFPIAKAYVHMRSAELMVNFAAEQFDRNKVCGVEANMAKMIAADASWEAADVAMQTHGGYAFAREYDIERKFRETRLFQIAPISTNLILSYIAEHELGLPRSY